MARIRDCSSSTTSTSTGDLEWSSMPGTARIAAPGTVFVHAVSSIAANAVTSAIDPQAGDRLAEPGMVEGIAQSSNTVAA